MISGARASLLGLCLLGGCASGAASRDAPFIVRVVSVHDTTGFTGDVEEEWRSYVIEPQGEPGRHLVVTDGGYGRYVGACHMTPGELYDLRLQRRRMFFGIRTDADTRLATDLFISGCWPVPSRPAITPPG
jgi:hypothetical protein